MATLFETKFRETLAEMLQLNQADLDFGIYRIMNQKRKDIEAFLKNRLVPEVTAILKANANDDTEKLKQELHKLEATLHAAGVNPDESTKVQDLKSKIAAGTDISAMENEVFSHLTKFFSRYYDGGDFISKRRYKDDTYAIPYSGEEVKLYWANTDQYYIKTSEYFKNYSFVLPATRRKVHFVLRDAETEQNNNKAANNMERRFQLCEENFIEEVDGELNIYFTYELMAKGIKQDVLIKDAEAKIMPVILEKHADYAELDTVKMPTNNDKNRSLLMKHLQDYTAKNNFDYFIHKDLGGFLRRELDFYIKNEVMFLDDLDANHIMEHLAQVKAIKQVGEKIITFLAQLEDFQKKLWLKKKFVVGCDYCITLDRVPHALYPEIIANDAQRKEWVRLFAIDEIKGDMMTEGYSEPLAEKFLDENPFLVLDTKFFSAEFKHKLVESMENVDEECNGVLINSDNFQALELLSSKYTKCIDGIYSDPPYNTGSDGFLYKDGYPHSSWLTMINDRLYLVNSLLKETAPIYISLNSNEFVNLVSSLPSIDTWFSIKVRHEERILRKDIKYQDVIEYLIQLNSTFNPSRIMGAADESLKDYIFSVKENAAPDEILEIGGFRIEKYKAGHYDIIKTVPSPTSLKRYLIRGSLITQSGSASEFYEGNLRERRNTDGYGCLYKVLGMGERGDGLGYRYIMQPEQNGGDNGIYFQGYPLNHEDKGLPRPNLYDFEADFNSCSNEGGVKFPGGKKPLAFMDKVFEISNFRKDAIVLDFFAGSGSTMHEVILRNKTENANRKYILIEMGEHFDYKTKTRALRSIYSPDKKAWKDGKPVSRKGISQCFKYLRLEQYEDTLNNLQPKQKTLDFAGDNGDFNETYLLSYMLDTETKGDLFNLEWFVHPFSMTLKTTKDNELVDTPVDMVETFNYLIGLNVETMRWPKDGYCVVEGISHIGNERTLVIWRDCEKVSNDALNEFFRKQAYSTTDSEFDKIYVNGDNTLPNIKTDEEHWKVVLIEEEFKKRMFS